jgi:hypothetical protein
MKLTLLEIVQMIASSMDSDEVNSITDSVESMQIASIVKESYIDLISRANLPEHYSFFELDASGDPTKPTLMTMPTDVNTLLWVKYDTRTTGDDPEFKLIKPMDTLEFVDYMHGLDSTATAYGRFTHTINGDTINFMYLDNQAPSYYTTFDDYTVVFDSYDSSVDTTLQKTKTAAYGLTIPTFTMSDSYTPDLDAKNFALLLNEAKRQAFVDLKQTQNPVAEQRAKRAWVRSQIDKTGVPLATAHSRLPNYGKR